MRYFSFLKKSRRLFLLYLLLLIININCGHKADPIPKKRMPPSQCSVKWIKNRTLKINLPLTDITGVNLNGLEKIRVYYMPLGYSKPTSSEIIVKGQVILERSWLKLLKPGETIELNMQNINYNVGWLTVVTTRVGNIASVPSEIVACFDPN